MTFIRAEVLRYDRGRPRQSVVFVPSHVDAEVADRAQPLVAHAIEQVVAHCGLTRKSAVEHLLAAAIEQIADSEAYEREAERRGVLAL